ncbi:MAG: hypothetical protein WCP52_07350, partial [Bacteroidota bacterium]
TTERRSITAERTSLTAERRQFTTEPAFIHKSARLGSKSATSLFFSRRRRRVSPVPFIRWCPHHHI